MVEEFFFDGTNVGSGGCFLTQVHFTNFPLLLAKDFAFNEVRALRRGNTLISAVKPGLAQPAQRALYLMGSAADTG